MAGPIANLTVRLSAQIAEFQSEFRNAQKSVDKFHGDFQQTATKIGKLGDMIGTGLVAAFGVLSVNSVKNWAVGVVDAASRIDDLSKKIGVSREAVQRWSHAADLSGASIDTVDRAVSFMNKTLAEGDKSTISALHSVGLQFDKIRQMRPEDAFNTIVKALEGIEDPMTRARVAMQLFGRTGQDLLPAIASGFIKAADAAKVMSDETIERLDKAGDAWTKLANIATIYSGEILASTMQMVEGATASWKNFFNFLAGSLPGVGTRNAAGLFMAPDLVKSAVPAVDAAKEEARRRKAVQDAIAAVDALEKETTARKRATKAADDYGDVLKRVQAAQVPLTESQRESAQQLLALGISYGDIAKVLRVSEIQVRKFAESQKLAAEIEKRLAEESTDAIREMVTEQSKLLRLRAREAGAAALDYVQSLELVSAQAKQVTEDWMREQGAAARAQLAAEVEATMPELVSALRSSAQKFLAPGDADHPLFDIGNRLAAGLIDALAYGIETGDWNGMKQAMQRQIAEAMGAAIAAGVNAVVPGLGTLLQPLFTGMSNLFLRAFDRNRGRDLVEDFAESFNTLAPGSGFDELQRRLATLGDEGHRLWVMLTQGVGRNNPEQARAAIEAVNEALGRQDSRLSNATAVLAEYGLTWEDAGQKFRNAHLAEQFDALHEKTLTLKEIGIDYNVILEKQAGQYSELVQAALRSGTEIPAAMRPILEDLVRMGLLVDANGNAFTNLEDVTWAKTMTQGFKDVTDAINNLTQALTRGVGGALDALERRRVTVPIGFSLDSVPNPGGTVSTGTTAGFASPQTITTSIYLDSDLIGRKTAPVVAGELLLNGV